MFGAPYDVTARDLLSSRLPRLVVITCLALACSLICMAPSVSAQYCTPDQCDECNLCRCSQQCCHSLPELWLVNTRCAPRCSNLDCGFERLIYKRYDRKCCRWVRETRESFLAHEATMPSLFYVHGNSLNHKNAMKGCWQIYCKMRCCPGAKRLVFWSWPAERVFKTKGFRIGEMIEKNLKIKYVYAEYQGYYMAKLVNMMSLSQRVMMSGHSYGGITSSAAAHLIGGGCLRGLRLEGGAEVERPNLRAAVISGAFDHDMLNPGNRYGQAFVAAEKIYVTRNIKDRTLKKWPKTSWRCRKAIGVLGVNANCLGVYRSKLCQQTMTSDVGTSHYLKPHLNSVKFVAALCCLSFPQCSTCSMADAASPADGMIVPANVEIDPAEVDVEQLSDEQLDDTDQLVEDEQFVYEAPFEFSDAELELAFAEGLSLGSDQIAQPTITVPTGITSRENQSYLTAAKAPRAPRSVPAFPSDAMLVAMSPHSASQPMTNASLYDEAASELVAVEETPSEPSHSQHSVTAEACTPKELTPSRSGNGLWYQCGLCLAIVLTGQFYVLFSKRVTPS